ncbi:MAG: phosphatase PAP2 family protein [Caldilineaceae bacterium]
MNVPKNKVDSTVNSTDSSYLQRVLQRLRTSWPIWVSGFIAIGLLGSFLQLAEDVWMKEAFAWDAPVMLAVHQLSTPWLNTLMIAITWIGSPGIILLAPLAAGWLWLRRRKPAAAIALMVSVIGAALLSGSLKLLFARPRPTVFPPLLTEQTYSFPSGHTWVSIAFYGFIAYLLWQHQRRVGAILTAAFALLIAFSRIYLGVHYPSDVLASLSIGLLWLGTVIGGYRHYQSHPTTPTSQDDAATSAPGERV